VAAKGEKDRSRSSTDRKSAHRVPSIACHAARRIVHLQCMTVIWVSVDLQP